MSEDRATTRLSRYCDANVQSLGRETPSDFQFRYVDLSSVNQGNIDWQKTRALTYASSPSRARRVVRPGSVLFSTVRPGLMGHGMVRETTDLPVIASTGFAVLAPKDGADGRFLFHALFLDEFKRQVAQFEVGSNYPAINESDLLRVKLGALDGPSQTAIADILDALDDAILEADALIEKLELVREGLVQSVLTFGIREDGRSRSQEALDTGRLGLRPKEWAICRIGGIATHVGSGATPRGGKDVYVADGALFVRSQNVHFDGLRLDDRTFITLNTHRAMAGSEIFEKDVLLNITGASIGRCCAFLGYKGPANVNQHVCAIRVPKASRADALYLSACLSADVGQRQIRTLLAGGSREGLNFGHVRSMIVPWPDAEERGRIADALSAIDSRTEEEKSARSKLELLRLGLRDDLLTGRQPVVAIREAAE